MRVLSIALNAGKGKNIVFNPNFLTEGIFRRTPALRSPATAKKVERQHRVAGAIPSEVLDFGPNRKVPEADMHFWERCSWTNNWQAIRTW